MTRKKDTDPVTPTQAADIIPAGPGHGLDAIKARIDKMRQQSPVREPGEPAGRGPLPTRKEPEPAPTPVTPPPLKPAEIEQCTLPGVPAAPKGKAPIGNQLARTPLFAPIKRGRRKIHNMSQLPAPQGIKLYYFGTQLDVGDQDTYLTAIMIAKGEPPNTRIRINRSEMLRLMGKKKSGAAFNWLAMSFRRIATGQLFYDTPTKEGSTPLLGPLEYDKETEEYYFIIPDASLRVFGFNDFGYVDMEKRRLLGVDLAKWLQCYAVSHAKGEHKISVENLMEWSGFEGRERQFRGRLKEALTELVEVGIIQSWGFYEHEKKVKWIR